MGAVDYIVSYVKKRERRGKIRKVKRGNGYEEANVSCIYVLIRKG